MDYFPIVAVIGGKSYAFRQKYLFGKVNFVFTLWNTSKFLYGRVYVNLKWLKIYELHFVNSGLI